jgi:hypothetical protein
MRSAPGGRTQDDIAEIPRIDQPPLAVTVYTSDCRAAPARRLFSGRVLVVLRAIACATSVVVTPADIFAGFSHTCIE